MDVTVVQIDRLEPHPSNSNVMPDVLFKKLKLHIEGTDRYPPLIIRPLPLATGADPTYQILDGHHRARALRELGRRHARCVVWDVDDDEALVLLATLNRLEGRDDPHKRAALMTRLHDRLGLAGMTRRLPEQAEQIRGLLALHQPPPPPRAPQPIEQMPVAVHFFLLPAQRDALENCLRRIDPSRESALMRLVDCHGRPDTETGAER